VGFFHPFNDPEEVVWVDTLGVEHDDDPSDNCIYLRPVDSFNVLQSPLHVPSDVFLAGTPDRANLNVRPPALHKDTPVASTRIYPIESGADGGSYGIAQSRRNGCRCLAHGSQQTNWVHANPSESRPKP
jgi:hypothetical protein